MPICVKIACKAVCAVINRLFGLFLFCFLLFLRMRYGSAELGWAGLSGSLHEQAARRRHGPLLSPARTLEGVTEGALPQHGSY